jgi:hypothetical protein
MRMLIQNKVINYLESDKADKIVDVENSSSLESWTKRAADNIYVLKDEG